MHVVGHDWGAAIAWTLAATRPDAVATLTALSVPHPAAFMRSLFTSRQFLMSWYMSFFQLPWLPELVIRPALHWYRAMPFNPPGRLAKVTVPILFVPSDSDPALGRTGAELTRRFVTGP
ncbi:alpha/beta fold hydrolase [Streptomyces sp. NPDC050844]|uniref:alpha/beta fold hydrolase n=1 Tax=Streptomyces sp. NPDC050844 TaxID=3155790 RepID=UPI0033D77BA5